MLGFPRLLLLRHAQSVYNYKNWLTGQVDCDLSEKGYFQAASTSKYLPMLMPSVDLLATSGLKRAQLTALACTKGYEFPIPTIVDDRLNERNYGDLNGLDKLKLVEKYGADQVLAWRRSFDAIPPGGESTRQTQKRVMGCYYERIQPLLKNGASIMLVAHGNSLRPLLAELLVLNDIAFEQLECGWAEPIVIEWSEDFTLKGISVYQHSNNEKSTCLASSNSSVSIDYKFLKDFDVVMTSQT